ncbi:AbgT family transporter [Streptomyces inhibens]|uniref:AbgT family transporter n=1 Tax=Streptomyces inhibens TaxID=2293571 RepID=A0A371PT82_STRIH|nr:AbgT family transporter [Streptomyces inhibens]REK85696.1 AbgT family transporter [Streptomyces inhibens]
MAAVDATAVDPAPPGLSRFLGAIERTGNRLPHPFWLFWILLAITAAASWVMAAAGLRVTDPGTGRSVAVRTVLSTDGAREFLSMIEGNFVTFGPLATVTIVMLGVAVAERAGFFETLARKALARVPATSVVPAVALAGALSKFLSDSAYIVLIPLGAIAFQTVGRSPVLGMIVAFVSINAAGDANPLIAPGDAAFAAMATEAAQTVSPHTVVRPTDNMYFTTVSAVVLAFVITFVVERVLARREHTLMPDDAADATAAPGEGVRPAPGPREIRALKLTGWAALGYWVLIALATLPRHSPLRAADGAIVESPLFDHIALFLSLFFLVIGLVYGRLTRTVAAGRDVPAFMADGLRSIAPLLVIFFAVSQFVALFKWTNIGTFVAVRGADALRELGAPTLILFLVLIVAVAGLNLLITSGQALWALVAPVLVPMLMLLHINPATTMALYRIADSCTNSITPMSTSFILTVGFLQTRKKEAGIGTLVSCTLPVALAMLLAWTLLFVVWWLLGLPLGPGAPVR